MENNIQTDMSPIYNTNASESLKNQLSDVLEFLTDFHTLSKIKVMRLTCIYQIDCWLIRKKICEIYFHRHLKRFLFSQSYSKGMQAGLNEDTIGGILKCGLAQYVALEITRGNNRENRAVARYLPWLYTTPSIQQG